MLRDQVGEARYRRATQIIDKFSKGGGDIYYEKYEDKLVKMLEKEVFRSEMQ